jgi:hypothetical protein
LLLYFKKEVGLGVKPQGFTIYGFAMERMSEYVEIIFVYADDV